MICTKDFVKGLGEANINFVTGVPDSLLKDICAEITKTLPNERHIIASNEGSAIALAIGYYLRSSQLALVYMQNSGLGNAVNPLTSLADQKVYSIPMLLLIGWRGGIDIDGNRVKDEPQHIKQGEITLDQLDVLGIPYIIIDKNTKNIINIIKETSLKAKKINGPIAIVVRKGSFSSSKLKDKKNKYLLSREEAIKTITRNIPNDIQVVSTTGVASRELFEIRKAYKEDHKHDFLTVGGMGHASSIATGIAIADKDKKIICIDGDGAALMHLGALAISSDFKNLIHILINNEVHDSVGAQPTKGSAIEFDKVASLLGYGHTTEANSKNEIIESLNKAINSDYSSFISIRVNPGFRNDLGRPTRTPIENKEDFMSFNKD